MHHSPAKKLFSNLLPPAMVRRLRRVRDRSLRHRIDAILAVANAPKTERAERDFETLQKEYNGVPEYGFDPHSFWKRGWERALAIAELPEDKNARCRTLEVGCGDAMTGVALSIHGHDVTVSDMDDWRDPRAKSLKFCKRLLEDGLPYENASFDLAYSFNAFEHFADPGKCFGELERLVASRGLVHLSFGPLFASAWGLHAYSRLNMPYPQYLFSEAFTAAKLAATGVSDLGKEGSALQPMNRWRFAQFRSLWENSRWTVVYSDFWSPIDQLSLVERYPECFSGRNLTWDDITTQAITVTLRKRG
jgi:SAM-dependent methyltransferase